MSADGLKGIDVSSNNSSNWEDDDWEYCWVKATEGKSYKNPDYAHQTGVVRDRGKVLGHYHWLNDGDVQAQVNWFLAESDVRDGDLIACDWEDPSDPTTAQKDDWIKKVKAAYPKCKVGLYCNRDWWWNHDTSGYAGDYLWIAIYNGGADPGIDYDWTFHQHGVEPYDLNRAPKFATLADLQAWAGSGDDGGNPDPPQPEPPKPIVDSGPWFSTDYLFPMVKPDPANAAGLKTGDRAEVTAEGLTARTLPGGPPTLNGDGETLLRPQGYQFDVTDEPVSGWITGGTNWYSSDHLKKATEPPPPSKPGWNTTPHKVLSMDHVPGSVSYLQGMMLVNDVHNDEGDWDPCWIVAQDYNNEGNLRFLLYSNAGNYQGWFQVNDAGHGQSFYAYRSAGGVLYVWCGEDPAYRYQWKTGAKVSRTSGTKMDYKGARPQGGYQDRVAFRNATDTKETFSIFDRTDFTDGTNKTDPIKEVTLSKRTDLTQQSYLCDENRIYRIYGSTNESPDPSGGKHVLDVFDWSGTCLLSKFDVTGMHLSGSDEDEPEGLAFTAAPGAVLAAKREGGASASARDYVVWEMTGLP